jgi:hypothetical protein
MSGIRWLALLPFIGILIGTPFFNYSTPSIFGFPLTLVWLVSWVVATSVIMAIVYRADPTTRNDAAELAKLRRGS